MRVPPRPRPVSPVPPPSTLHTPPEDLTQHDSGIAGMVAGGRILLLIGGLVFLVDNHQSEPLEGQEHGTTGSEDDIVGICRELFLPDLHALGIGVFAVVDAQSTAEDPLQTFHHLYGEGNLGQEIEHLLMTVEGLLDEVDIDFGLSTGGDTMEQGDILFEKGELDLVEGFLLWGAEGFDTLGMGLAAMVQAPYLLFVGLEESALDEGSDGGEGVALVLEFVASDTQIIVYS